MGSLKTSHYQSAGLTDNSKKDSIIEDKKEEHYEN